MEILNRRYDCILGLFTAVFSAVCFIFIFCTIDRGTSCDEGYYLLAYLPDQPMSWGVSQFGFIVRKIFWFLPDDAALYLRYIRFFLNILILAFFSFSSFVWLKKKYSLSVSPIIYYSLVFLSGILSFGFATPILYYDNIQLFIYLLVFGIYFLLATYDSSFIRNIFWVLIGIFCVFGVFNYISSGILLIIILLILLLTETNYVKNILFLFAGILLGVVVYHLFIRNVIETFNDIFSSFLLAQKGLTRHNNEQLAIALLQYLLEFIVLFGIFSIIGWVVSFIITFRNNKIKYLSYILTAIIVFAILLHRWLFYKYYTGLFIMPIAFIFSYAIYLKSPNNTNLLSFKKILTVAILIFIPLTGVFGTNQNISAKMLFFMPFWVTAYFLLISFIDFKHTAFLKISHSIYVLLLIGGFTYLVYFSRYHYYYSPKQSNTNITDTSRFRNIRVSGWQKEFNDRAIHLLNDMGFKKGDKILAFYDNFITVYMAGGYVPNNLIYQFEVFASDKQNIPSYPVNYILIIEEQEKAMQSFLKHTDWGFPSDYMRFDLGKAAENLPAQYNSILYIRKI